MNAPRTWLIVVALLFGWCVAEIRSTPAEEPYSLSWIRQLGTPNTDSGYGIVFDDDENLYLSGLNYGVGPNSENYDAFLGKYNSSGDLLWSRQYGTPSYDASRGVAVDAAGSIFITGETFGNLGGENLDGWDGYLSKVDNNGDVLWTEQFGASTWDGSLDVVTDTHGNAIIAGYTEGLLGDAHFGDWDAIIAKYDTDGNRQWIRQLGSSAPDSAGSVAVDNLGNVYATGSTEGAMAGANAGSSDVFLSKFDVDGNHLWTKQFGGLGRDTGNSVVVDESGNVTIGGRTRSSLSGLNAGRDDGFLARFDSAGNSLWVRQFGTSTTDVVNSLAVDSNGFIFATGSTTGALGESHVGSYDFYLSKFDLNGTNLWTKQFGDGGQQRAQAVDVSGAGNVALAGNTYGDWAAPNSGGSDFIVAKFIVVPEPSSVSIAIFLFSGMLLCSHRTC